MQSTSDTTDVLAELLGRQALLHGPGHRLPAAETARIRGFSRNAGREAVRMLMAKGLVTRSSSTPVVADRSHWSLLDPDVMAWRPAGPDCLRQEAGLAALARAVDADAARQAAHRPESAYDALNEALKMWATGSIADAPQADHQFHRALLACGAGELMRYLGSLIAGCRLPGPYCTRPLHAHRALLHHIHRGDGAAAAGAATALYPTLRTRHT